MLKNSKDFKITSIQSLTENMPLPEEDFIIERAQLFMFSAITWNRHKIHYDLNAAKDEGYSDVLVHRGLIGNLFCRYIATLFPDFFTKQLDWKVINSAAPKHTLVCGGQVNTLNEEEAELKLFLKNDKNDTVADATAYIRHINDTDLARPVIAC